MNGELDEIKGMLRDILDRQKQGEANPVRNFRATSLADISNVLGNVKFPPSGARVTRSAVQSIPNASATNVIFTLESYDDAGYFTSTVDDTRLTVQPGFEGRYSIGFFVTWASAITSTAEIKKGGSTVLLGNVSPSSVYNSAEIDVELAKNEYIQLTLTQSSGGAVNVTPVMWIRRVR